jgi:hypothetical protein
MKQSRISLVALAVLVLGLAAPAVDRGGCPTPQYEDCSTRDGTDNEFQNCRARNQQEDARYQQCLELKRWERHEQAEERRRQAREEAWQDFCRQSADVSECR